MGFVNEDIDDRLERRQVVVVNMDMYGAGEVG
jgi:hypothetical protein